MTLLFHRRSQVQESLSMLKHYDRELSNMRKNVDSKQTAEKAVSTENNQPWRLIPFACESPQGKTISIDTYGAMGGGAIAAEITRANPTITEAITMATARFPFFISSHSSTGVSQVKIDSKTQREIAMVKMPTAPQPISFR